MNQEEDGNRQSHQEKLHSKHASAGLFSRNRPSVRSVNDVKIIATIRTRRSRLSAVANGCPQHKWQGMNRTAARKLLV